MIPASFLIIYLGFVVLFPDAINMGLIIAFGKALLQIAWFFTDRAFRFLVLLALLSDNGELESLVLSDNDQWVKQKTYGMGELVFDFFEEAGISANETGFWFLFTISTKVAQKQVPIEGGIVARFMAGQVALGTLYNLRIYIRGRKYSQRGLKA